MSYNPSDKVDVCLSSTVPARFSCIDAAVGSRPHPSLADWPVSRIGYEAPSRLAEGLLVGCK